ncbi:RNA-binding S4 domain-containing protein [Zhaonella formicivorans]|uniref:RNA-binding S4 domain-containing protein n=1 Tax=Zhaonella formicivorans TaxID=2528593 RepID=UPI0024143B72|nr:RNA-binding S4 domain-containing protein [Zhaonella formicivorans]
MSDNIEEILINTIDIKLDQFLKWAELVSTGGEAKQLITSGQVKVNGSLETRRGRRLQDGDVVEVKNKGRYKVSRTL